MADRIKGITIEIGGDTTNLQKSLKGVDSQLRTTQATLKDVNKLLKLDPGNTELLTQKQKNLESAISGTKERLDQLRAAQSGVEKGSAEWDALQREIIATEQSLKSLENEYKSFGSVSAQQIKAAGAKVSELGGKISDVGEKLKGLSAGAGAIGGALLKMGYDAITGADDLNTLAKQTGFSTEEIQKMQYAADLIDVSFEDISGALKKFKSKIDPANESLQALGVETLNADGSLRNANDVFFDAVSALSGISNETERDQMAMELFGKSADSLAGIIDDGGAALNEFGAQAEEMGLILDQDTLNSLNATNDTIDQLKATIGGTVAQIGADVGTVLAPVIQKAGELIGKITERLRDLTPEQTETILKIVGVVAALAPALIIGGKIVSTIGSVISVLGTVIGVLGGPLTAVIAAVVAAGVLIYTNWDTIKAKAISLKDGVVAAWQGLKDKVSSVVSTLQGKIQTLKSKFDSLKSGVSNVISSIKSALSFDWKLPTLKVPHITVEGGEAPWGIGGKGKLPSFNVQWYRSAYDNPVMFTSPTVLQTPQGYKGFGDGSGAEIVLGLDRLRDLVGGMSGNNNVSVQVILEGDAQQIFRVVRQTNTVRTKSTNYNALAAGV